MWPRSGPLEVGRLSVEGLIESFELIGLLDLHRRDAVDQPEHSVGEEECPCRGDGYGGELHEEEVRVAAQQAVHAGGIEGRRGEDAAEDDAEEAAHSVNAPDIERVVPLQTVLERHGV